MNYTKFKQLLELEIDKLLEFYDIQISEITDISFVDGKLFITTNDEVLELIENTAIYE